MDKPDVDVIEGLSPAISIEQKATFRHNPRSTVGTVTEIHDYLRLLCLPARRHALLPDHGLPLAAQSVSQMVDALALPEGHAADGAGPVVRDRKGEFPSSSPTCRRRASCASASTARRTRSMNCPS